MLSLDKIVLLHILILRWAVDFLNLSSRNSDQSHDALITAKNRYFELTHRVQEEVMSVPKCLKVRWED